MSPNRIAVYLTSLSGLATAVAVPLANLDTQSTAGVIGGLGAIALVVNKWLTGWQAHEEGMRSSASLDPEDDGEDGDNVLDPELESRVTSDAIDAMMPDEVDRPEQTQLGNTGGDR